VQRSAWAGTGSVGVPGAGVAGAAVVGAGGVDAAAADAAFVAGDASAVIAWPQLGQAIQPGSTAARQPGQRPRVNGSTTPQKGHAATLLSM
jgi:hypothetical protein